MGSVQSGGGSGGVPLRGAVSGEGKGREWGNFGGHGARILGDILAGSIWA